MNNFNQTNKYDDIINLPHHVSSKHLHMKPIDRAAQFSPFAALTGHNEAIKETARLTDNRIELDEGEKASLNERLQIISDNLNNQPAVSITYFKPDDKKSGGAYLTVTGIIKKIDEYKCCVQMTDSSVIAFEDIISIEGELF